MSLAMEVTGEEVHCQNRFSRTGCDQQTTQANGQLCVPLTAAAAADMQSVLIIKANQLGAITLDGQLV